MPTSRMAAISNEVATGRKMNGRDGLTGRCSRSRWPRQAWSTPPDLIRNDDLGVVLQLLKAAVGDHVSGIDAVNLRHTAICNSRLDAAHMSDAVLNHVHERCLAVVLDGGGGDQRHPLQRIHQQPGVHKLVGEERVVLVVEDGSRFHRARRRVNLVVEGQQLAAGNLRLRSAIKGIHGELRLWRSWA